MPYVEGESLRKRLDREKQLPVADALRVATGVASALDYAHRHDVVHRDIKPENILLHDGQLLVADFGIALALSTAGSSRMTETGMSLGTPTYMSPEQAMGEREIDGRTDIYSLGCVVYEMLTGDPPFTGSTAQAIAARVLTETPRSLIAQRHTVSEHVEAAVLTALEKLPADRYPTAQAFADALEGSPATTPLAVLATRRDGSMVAFPPSHGGHTTAGSCSTATPKPAWSPPRWATIPRFPSAHASLCFPLAPTEAQISVTGTPSCPATPAS
jgi:serine/threonine protein kinase